MNICGRITNIKTKKNIMFIIVSNRKTQQIVIKGDKINYYYNLLNVGDIINCKVLKDLNNNGKYKSEYASYTLIDLKILSKNIKNFKLPINTNNLIQYSETKYNIRKYLHRLGYLEVDLPILTNGEISSRSESFCTIYSKEKQKLFLRKTMDTFLRMYTCNDVNKVFSIGSCFRNEYLTSKNKPEFEMLSIFSNYINQNEAINLAIKILMIITSKEMKIEYMDESEYNNVAPLDNVFYIISNYENLDNSYCSINDYNKTNEFRIKYKNVTIVHGVSEIYDYNEYIEKIENQGKKENYGELQVLEDLINSGAPKCYNLGISIIRILSLYNNLKIKDYDIFSFDRLNIGGRNEK